MMSIKDLKTDKLGNLTSLITRGISPKYSEGEGHLVLNQKCIRDNRINIQLARNYDKNQRIKKGCILEEGDVLINSTGIGTLSRSAIVKDVTENMTLDSHITLVRTKKDIADAKYIGYHVELLEPVIENFANGSTGQTELSRKDVYNLDIIIHELPTQKRIASILSAYDELIEVNNQRIKLLEETARELYKEWFVRMRFPGYKQAEFVKGVPEGWTYDTCYSFADVKGGGTPSTINPQYWEGEINFFTPTDHSDSFYIFETEKKITEKGLKNSSTKLFSKYSTFITARGTVGNICLAGNDMAMNQSCFGIVSHKSVDCFFTFLFTDEMIRYLKLVASGATFDAITLNTFKNYKAPIPCDELREKYFHLASPMFFQIENLIQQNTQLRQIRDRLLPRLISGKLSLNGDLYDGDDGHDSKSLKSNKSNKS